MQWNLHLIIIVEIDRRNFKHTDVMWSQIRRQSYYLLQFTSNHPPHHTYDEFILWMHQNYFNFKISRIFWKVANLSNQRPSQSTEKLIRTRQFTNAMLWLPPVSIFIENVITSLFIFQEQHIGIKCKFLSKLTHSFIITY